jgi:hypothetical protein
MQPFQGKKLKIPHGASSQQTEAALSRLQVLGSRMNLFNVPDALGGHENTMPTLHGWSYFI